MKGFSYISAVTSLAVKEDACTGCGMCTSVCPHAVLTVVARKAVIQRLELCMECGACARNCPADAISVDTGVGCASGLITEWFRSINKDSKPSGCC